VTFTLALLLANTARLLDQTIEDQARLRIADLAPTLNAALAPSLVRRDDEGTRRLLRELVDGTESIEYLVALDSRGRAIAHAGPIDPAALPAPGSSAAVSDMVFHGALPLSAGAGPVGELRYGLSLAGLARARANVLYQGAVVALAAVLATIAALALAGYLLTRHLARLVDATRAISAGRYDARVEVETGDEIGRLAQDFNEMIDAVKANVRALREREERARSMASVSSDWYWEQDEQFRFREIDDPGAKPERRAMHHVGRRRWELEETNLSAEQWAAHRAQLERHEPFHDFEYRRTGGDGKPHWVSISGVPIFDDAGRFRGYRGVGKDISERKEAEALAARLGRVLDQSANEIYLFCADDLHFVSVNEGALRSLGYTMEEMRALTPVDIKPEFTRERFEALLAPLRTGQRTQLAFETVHRRKDGTTYPVEVRLHLSRSEDPPLFIAVILDIGERRRAEQALRASEERLRLALTAANQGLYDLDLRTGNAVVSPEYARMLGYEPEELRETDAWWRERLHPEDRASVERAYEDYIAGRRAEYRVEFRQRTKSGDWKWILSLGKIVERDRDGIPLRMLGTHTDITERKLAEQAVRRLNAELEERVRERTAQLEAANKELETFTYSVSHDLKAPLRGIDGYSRLLLEGYADRLDDEGRRFLGNVRQAAAQMSELIDDLLAYSRLERRKLEAEAIDLAPLVESLLAERGTEVRGRAAAITVNLPCARLRADREGLTMALRNLIDNALKFSRDAPQPRIEIGGRAAAGSCMLWVRDNGTGFDMKFHDRIFDIFQRLHRAEDYPGTGIGLAIVRKAMERMDGRAWAESEPGKGATFYLELPQ
jgi:PAS domain S-box-containing protein